MTEAEWLALTGPAAILAWVSAQPADRATKWTNAPVHYVATDRKLRLFACACCRQVWNRLTDPRSRQAVEVAERYADVEASELQRAAALIDAIDAFHENAEAPWVRGLPVNAIEDIYPPGQLIQRATRSGIPPVTQAALLRCIFGNPWRPVTGASLVETLEEVCRLDDIRYLARAIYHDRRWDDLPILADALWEAGCQSDDLFNHLRNSTTISCPNCAGTGDSNRNRHERVWDKCSACAGEGTIAAPHARGCWALDLILGKE